MTVVPKVLGISHVHCITFYQWLDLGRCELKGLGRALVLDGRLPEMPPTRSQLIGTFHHRLMELAATVDSVDTLDILIEDEIQKLQIVVSASTATRKYGSASGWHEVNQSATLARSQLAMRGPDATESVVASEVELRSRHGMLVGRPDRFSVRQGLARLREYKTGRIRTEAGEARPDYLEQLRFYATLIFDNYQVRKVAARVESLDGDSYEVDVQQIDADALVEAVSKVLAALNEKIATRSALSSFATPGPEVCSSCRCQVICSAFKSSQSDISLVGEQYLSEGVVTAIAEAAVGSVKAITMSDEWRRVSVTYAVPTDLADGIVIGKRYVIQGLSSHGGKLVWGSASRVLSCD